MKRIRQFFIVTMIMVLVFPIFVFADASDIKIGMTKEEVINAMDKKGVEGKANNGMDDLITFKDVNIGDYTFKMECAFRDDLLISKNYSTTESGFIPTVHNALRKALEEKYGKRGKDNKILKEAFASIGSEMSDADVSLLLLSGLQYSTWKQSEDTNICLMYLSNKSFTCLVYCAPDLKVPKKKIDSNDL